MKYCPHCRRTYSETQRFCLEDGALLSLQDPYHLVGRILADKYRIDALVGVGGMGAVYSAHQLGVERRVAFKILQPNIALSNKRTVDLFEREAKLAGSLSHENIAVVYDSGRTSDGIAYIAMEWLEGQTLDEELAAGPLSFERTARILRQVAAALDEAHAGHIIHRDLKPSNVMIVKRAGGREQVKVLDLGISKVISDTVGSPVSQVVGTPHYASPEQFRVEGQIDTRSDIYSLGVMLYRMLTGRFLFEAPSTHKLIQMHLTAPPPLLRGQRPDAPAAIEQLINRMLAKEPDRRPARAGEVAALFDRSLSRQRQAPPAVMAGDAQQSAQMDADDDEGEVDTQPAPDRPADAIRPKLEAAAEDVKLVVPLQEKTPATSVRAGRTRSKLIPIAAACGLLLGGGYGLYRYAFSGGQTDSSSEQQETIAQAEPTKAPAPSPTPSPSSTPRPSPTLAATPAPQVAQQRPSVVAATPSPTPNKQRASERLNRAYDRPKNLEEFLQQKSDHLNRARALYDRGQYVSALKECDEVLRLDPTDQAALNLRRRIKKTIEILNR